MKSRRRIAFPTAKDRNQCRVAIEPIKSGNCDRRKRGADEFAQQQSRASHVSCGYGGKLSWDRNNGATWFIFSFAIRRCLFCCRGCDARTAPTNLPKTRLITAGICDKRNGLGAAILTRSCPLWSPTNIQRYPVVTSAFHLIATKSRTSHDVGDGPKNGHPINRGPNRPGCY
jgi:hypothetical protein